MCQRCGRAPAAWHDYYRDQGVCEGCCPDRASAYAMAFVGVLTGADARRLSEQTERDRDEAGGGR